MADATPNSDNAANFSADDLQAAADAALKAANEAAAAANSSGDGTTPFSLPEFPANAMPLPGSSMDFLSDVNLNVKIELGRTRMLVEDVLKLSEGAVVELDKLAGDPVDVYVNDRHVARGEVLVLNDNFCVRISEIISRNVEGEKNSAA